MGSLQVSLAVLSAALLLADDASACGKHRGRRAGAGGGSGGATTMVIADCGQPMTESVPMATAPQIQTMPQVQYQIAETGSSCGSESGRRGLFHRRHR